jgi:hypothetical protein
VHYHPLRSLLPEEGTGGGEGGQDRIPDHEAFQLQGTVVVPGTSFGKGVKLLLPKTQGGAAGASERGGGGSQQQAVTAQEHLMTLLVPTWYGVSLSQSADWGRRWGPPSPFMAHGRHKESVVVRSERLFGPQVLLVILYSRPMSEILRFLTLYAQRAEPGSTCTSCVVPGVVSADDGTRAGENYL